MIIDIKGYKVLIDDEDYEKVMKYTWYSNTLKRDSFTYYYFTSYYKDTSKRYITISLHRYLMGCVNRDGKLVDHINGNTLDNRKENLRIANYSTNARNCKRASNNTSGHKGVHFHKATGKYRTSIRIDGGKRIYSKGYATAELAYKEYCKLSEKYHGEFGRVE